MNANGVLGSMCFPSFPQFCGQLFARTTDKDVGLAMLQAYNDWHIDEWCGTYPGRFIPLSLPPLWDPQLMADEVRRVAAKGCHAVTFSENPEKLGCPSFHSDHWDPFWQACSRRGHGRLPAHRLVVAAGDHVGRRADRRDDHVAADEHRAGRGRPAVVAGAAQVPRPASSRCREGGIGWIPYFLERRRLRLRAPPARGRARTSATSCRAQLFRERIITCFIDDPAGVEIRHRVGIDTHHLGVRLPALRLDVAAVARALDEVARRRARRRDRQDHAPERHAALPASTRSRCGRASSARSARCGPRRPTSTWLEPLVGQGDRPAREGHHHQPGQQGGRQVGCRARQQRPHRPGRRPWPGWRPRRRGRGPRRPRGGDAPQLRRRSSSPAGHAPCSSALSCRSTRTSRPTRWRGSQRLGRQGAADRRRRGSPAGLHADAPGARRRPRQFRPTAAPQPRVHVLHVGHDGPAQGRGARRPAVGRRQMVQDMLRQLWGFTPDDVYLLCGPAYHAGPGGYAFTTLFIEGTVVVMPTWDAREWLRLVDERPGHHHVHDAGPLHPHPRGAGGRASRRRPSSCA